VNWTPNDDARGCCVHRGGRLIGVGDVGESRSEQ